MCLSPNRSRFFLIIALAMFLASGCSGHSVKYGANSEGDGIGSEGDMSAASNGILNGTARNPDGTPIQGGTVDGNNPYLQSGQGTPIANGETNAEMETKDKNFSISEAGSNYGRQFDGVDGSGPGYGGVSGFGSGSANSSNPDPEAWANAYLRGKGSSQEFYGDLSGKNDNSSMENNAEAWAQAYVKENGGPSPEHVTSEIQIAQAKGSQGSDPIGVSESNGEYIKIRDTSPSYEGRVQDIYFAFDSWSISAEGAKYLEEDAKWLHANPEKALTIEGHCDQRGTQDYNLVLGKKRAEAAREYLINLGVQPHRIKIVSYGKERPFCQHDNEACFQKNRRNHMVVRMNQS